METDPQVHAFEALSRFLIARSPLRDTLTQISRIGVDTLPGAAFAGMTLVNGNGRATTAVFTDDESPEIDEAQYRSGQGPCLDAWRRNEVVRIDDISAGYATYPEFCTAAAEHGVGSTMSLPLHADGEGLGALNLYARTTHAFDERDEQMGMSLVAVASVLLANSRAYWGAVELSQQLDEALSTRPIIDQAKGILMAQTPGLDAEGAFDLLRKASQRENHKLRDIAARIIASLP